LSHLEPKHRSHGQKTNHHARYERISCNHPPHGNLEHLWSSLKVKPPESSTLLVPLPKRSNDKLNLISFKLVSLGNDIVDFWCDLWNFCIDIYSIYFATMECMWGTMTEIEWSLYKNGQMKPRQKQWNEAKTKLVEWS